MDPKEADINAGMNVKRQRTYGKVTKLKRNPNMFLKVRVSNV